MLVEFKECLGLACTVAVIHQVLPKLGVICKKDASVWLEGTPV